MAVVPGEPIEFSTEDGRRLAGRWWSGADAARRTAVLLPGIAAPQQYLRWFAGHLAGRGWGALTFDYRSVGGSREGADDQATLDDWVELDLPAAAEEAMRRGGAPDLVAVAHSIGGQLLGQSPALLRFRSALLISAQRGMPRLYSKKSYWRVLYAYALFPLLIRLTGRLPVSRFTLPEHCSGRALRQWVRWGRTGVFTNEQGEVLEPRYGRFHGPLTAVTVSDDNDFAPAPAVEALTRLYTGARVRRETLAPGDYGLPRLGHFGFFHPRAPKALWEKAETWLREMEG